MAVHLVSSAEITRLNETFLHHRGPTDVIAFNYSEANPTRPNLQNFVARATKFCTEPTSSSLLHGEIFICPDEAKKQARRFHTTWQSELVRYAIHGLLHLCGYDDRRAGARQKMKREESRILRQISGQLDLARLGSA